MVGLRASFPANNSQGPVESLGLWQVPGHRAEPDGFPKLLSHIIQGGRCGGRHKERGPGAKKERPEREVRTCATRAGPELLRCLLYVSETFQAERRWCPRGLALSEAPWGPPLEGRLGLVGKTQGCQMGVQTAVETRRGSVFRPTCPWRRFAAAELPTGWCGGRGGGDGPHRGCGQRLGLETVVMWNPWVNIRCWGPGRHEEGDKCTSDPSWLTDVGSLEIDRLHVVFELVSSSGPSVVPKDSVAGGFSIRDVPITELTEGVGSAWGPCVGTKHWGAWGHITDTLNLCGGEQSHGL